MCVSVESACGGGEIARFEWDWVFVELARLIKSFFFSLGVLGNVSESF